MLRIEITFKELGGPWDEDDIIYAGETDVDEHEVDDKDKIEDLNNWDEDD